MNEAEFQRAVLQIALMYAWRAYHTFDSRRSAAGFPDLVLVRPPRLIFAELKQDGKNPTIAQSQWLDDLRGIHGANVEVYVWRPADLDALPAIFKR